MTRSTTIHPRPKRRERSVLTCTDTAFAARDGRNVRTLDPCKVGWGIKTRAKAWETASGRRIVTPSGESGKSTFRQRAPKGDKALSMETMLKVSGVQCFSKEGALAMNYAKPSLACYC